MTGPEVQWMDDNDLNPVPKPRQYRARCGEHPEFKGEPSRYYSVARVDLDAHVAIYHGTTRPRLHQEDTHVAWGTR